MILSLELSRSSFDRIISERIRDNSIEVDESVPGDEHRPMPRLPENTLISD